MTSTSEGILAWIFHGFQWAWGSNWEAMFGSFFQCLKIFLECNFKTFLLEVVPPKACSPEGDFGDKMEGSAAEAACPGR